MHVQIFSLFLTFFISALSFAAPDSLEVMDSGVRSDAKIEKIQKVPLGHTRIVIERNEQQQISQILIEQSADIRQSGVALEITDLLADLVEGDAIVETPVVRVHQEISMSGDVEVKGIRFAGKSVRNEKLLKNVELDVIQNVPIVDEGQVWTSQAYAMAHIHDYAGLQEVAMGMASGTPARRSLGEVASFPGAESIYRKIVVGGKIGPVKGRLNHIAMEKAMAILPIRSASDCSPHLDEKPNKTLH